MRLSILFLITAAIAFETGAACADSADQSPSAAEGAIAYLPVGPARPDKAALDAFWQAARESDGAARLSDTYQVRWFGIDEPTTNQILKYIADGDKTGTFTLPWILSETGQAMPQVGDSIIVIDYSGNPRLAINLTQIQTVPFGQIGPEHTALDGPSVRELSVWTPIHRDFWNGELARFDRSVTDDMPVLVESFEVVYSGSQ